MVEWQDMGHAAALSISAVLGVVGANYLTTYITTPWQEIVAGAVVFLIPMYGLRGHDGAMSYLRIFLMVAGITALVRGLAAQFNITQLSQLTMGTL